MSGDTNSGVVTPTRYTALDVGGGATSRRGIDLRLSNLALKYVREREQRGDLVPRAARDVRYKLLDFCELAPKSPAKITRRHVEKFIERPDLAPGTRRLMLSAVRGFLQWLVIRGDIKRDPTLGVKAPKTPKSAPRRLISGHATATALQAPDARGRVMVLLMLQEGLRCCEVERAELGDVDLVAQTMGVRGKGGRAEITRWVHITAETAGALERYLTEHPASAGPLIRSYTQPNRAMTASYIGQLVTRWMYEAGAKQRPRDGKTPHSLRHTALSDMAEQGADVLTIGRAAGHDSLNSTLIYLRGVTPDLRTAMEGRTYLDPGSLHPKLPFG